jgi:hypothetical protein
MLAVSLFLVENAPPRCRDTGYERLEKRKKEKEENSPGSLTSLTAAGGFLVENAPPMRVDRR